MHNIIYDVISHIQRNSPSVFPSRVFGEVGCLYPRFTEIRTKSLATPHQVFWFKPDVTTVSRSSFAASPVTFFSQASQTPPSQNSHRLSLRSHTFGMSCKCQTAAADDITARFPKWRSHHHDRCCRYGNLALSALLPNVTLQTKFGLAQLSITAFFSPVTI